MYVCMTAIYNAADSQRMFYGLIIVYDIVATIVAQYTFSLVVFLKLNGNQHTTFRDVGWPFYVNWVSIFLSVAAFYVQPTEVKYGSMRRR